MSSGTLNQRADEIIFAAKLACFQANAGLPATYADDDLSRDIIKDALDRAGCMVKAVAAETTNTREAIEPTYGTTDAPILRST